MVNGMETIRLFVADYIRLMRGRPLLGGGVDRTSEEIDARAAGKRFSQAVLETHGISFEDDPKSSGISASKKKG